MRSKADEAFVIAEISDQKLMGFYILAPVAISTLVQYDVLTRFKNHDQVCP